VEIPANSEIEVILRARAIETGDFSGDFDVCINTEMNCEFASVRTFVSE
tara:strand:+ start:1934 stop:2080 length:147 start_codon:yes stop_codon:yes gene_type:complete